jgi:methionine-rich copper-binding protein CopC
MSSGKPHHLAGGGSIRAALAYGLVTAIALGLGSNDAGAHAFVSRTEPRSGATVAEPPTQIRIWFDGPVEPLFIDLRVENGDKRRVDKGDGRSSRTDSALVEAGLAPLAPGRYRVFWSVIARDGHRREGSFSFLVK